MMQCKHKGQQFSCIEPKNDTKKLNETLASAMQKTPENAKGLLLSVTDHKYGGEGQRLLEVTGRPQ